MTIRQLLFVLVAIVEAGCASLSNQIPTRSPEGRSAADIAQDQAQCEAFGKGQPKHQGDHYQACMMARGYAANVYMDDVGRTISVVQTRPHEPGVVLQDMAYCDSRADSTKNSDVITLTPEQERSIKGLATGGAVFGMAYRPNAIRMLAACLSDRGYAIVPWVQFQ